MSVINYSPTSDEKRNIESLWSHLKVNDTIGFGGEGVVYSATRGNQKKVVKHICITIPEGFPADSEKRKQYINDTVNEYTRSYKFLTQFNGSPTITHIDDFQIQMEEESANIYILMDQIDSLADHIVKNGFTEQDLRQLGLDISAALIELGNHHILHRDIKPSNIFFRNGYYVLGDFGGAVYLDSINKSTITNDLTTAPEVFQSGKFDFRSDIYSLGMTLYIIANKSNIVFLDENSNRVLPLPSNITSKELCEAIFKACDNNPDNRFQNAVEFNDFINDITIKHNTILYKKGSKPDFHYMIVDSKTADGVHLNSVLSDVTSRVADLQNYTIPDPAFSIKYNKKERKNHKCLSSWLFSTCMISIIPTIFYLMCILFVSNTRVIPSLFLHEFVFFAIVLLTNMIKTIFWGEGKTEYGIYLFPMGAIAIIMDTVAFVLFSLIIVSEVLSNIELKHGLFPVACILCVASLILGGITEYMEDLVV